MEPEETSTSTPGRPLVFADAALRQAAGFSYARSIRTRRGAQDLVYRKFAVAAIELYSEAFPDRATTLSWFLAPHLRHTLLTELGRVAQPRSDESGSLRWAESDVLRLIDVALEVGEAKPSTKAGVVLIRERRRRYRQSG